MAAKRRLRDPATPLVDPTLQHLLLLFFVAHDSRRLGRLLSLISPGYDWRIVFDDDAGHHPLVCRWSSTSSEIGFTFGRFVFDHLCDGTIRRWRGLLTLFERVASRGGFIGTVNLNLSDLGIAPGLCFSDHRDVFELIPDMSFIESAGYADYRRHFQHCRDWSGRLDTVFWRGSTTGFPPEKHLAENRRAALCLLASTFPDDRLDFGISQVVQFTPAWTDAAHDAGIVKDYVPWQSLDTYQYHIDIDGNTNSWPGLFSKLLSGGVVLKVDSEHGYKQWYYSHLRPWLHYVPVRSDLSDLIDVVRYLRAHPSCAERIGRQGRQFACSLTWESELDLGVEIVVAYAAKQAFRTAAELKQTAP